MHPRVPAALLVSVAAWGFCASAHAEPAPAPRPSAAAPPAAVSTVEPEADLLTHLRATANLGLSTWVIWQMNWLRGVDWVPITRDSLARNLRRGLTFDKDELQTNFFGHPYHGGLMFNSARAAGLGFWQSTPYTFGGSLFWELFAEREPPSANDLLVTTLAGILLGEMAHRLSSELLDPSQEGGERLLRELGATAVSPMLGVNRFYTGDAWADGPKPRRHPLALALHAGMDRLRVQNGDTRSAYTPTLLLAADVRYGDLLPRSTDDTLAPLEFFELYAAVNLFSSELEGAQVLATGLLHGWSHDIAPDTAADNAVFGFAMTYEFLGSNLATYGAVGLGPASFVAFRGRRRPRLQLGAGLDVVPMLGVTPGEPLDGERPYNFSSGLALWGSAAWDLRHAGLLRLRSRHYVTAVLDGATGFDYITTTRLSYEVDGFRGVGVGVAPMLTYRRRLGGVDDASTFQLQAQVYLRLHY